MINFILTPNKRREGQDDYWLNIGLVFPHKDRGGFNIMLQAFPLDGKIVRCEITEAEEPTGTMTPLRSPQSRPLELDVTAHAVAIDNLTEKNGTSVTELRYESPELVASISHGERLASRGHAVSREDLHTLRGGKLHRIELEMPREVLVQRNLDAA